MKAGRYSECFAPTGKKGFFIEQHVKPVYWGGGKYVTTRKWTTAGFSLVQIAYAFHLPPCPIIIVQMGISAEWICLPVHVDVCSQQIDREMAVKNAQDDWVNDNRTGGPGMTHERFVESMFELVSRYGVQLIGMASSNFLVVIVVSFVLFIVLVTVASSLAAATGGTP